MYSTSQVYWVGTNLLHPEYSLTNLLSDSDHWLSFLFYFYRSAFETLAQHSETQIKQVN